MQNTHDAKPTGRRRRRTEAEGAVILARYWESGLTQRAFALKAGVSVSTLQYWLRWAGSVLEAQPSQAVGSVAAPAISLLGVELAGSAPLGARGAGGYEIEMSGGICLRLPESFEDGEVRRLLALLKEVR